MAKKLLKLADIKAPVEDQARRGVIEEWYAASKDLLDIGGDQGEIARNCYYTPKMVEAERRWKGSSAKDRPVGRSLRRRV